MKKSIRIVTNIIMLFEALAGIFLTLVSNNLLWMLLLSTHGTLIGVAVVVWRHIVWHQKYDPVCIKQMKEEKNGLGK